MEKIARLIGLYLNVLSRIAPGIAGRQGFNIFCTPQAPPVKQHHQEFFDTSEKRVLTYEKLKLQTYKWGNGDKKVLLLHGWQSHSFRWKAYIEALAKEGYTVYAMDAPAHGLSTGKYINLVIYAGAIECVVASVGRINTVISHSFGSFSSLYALHRSPALPIEKLVIMGTPGEATDFVSYYRGVLGLTERSMKILRDYFIKTIGQPPEYFSAPAFASTLTVPGLIIHDEEDDETPYKNAVRIHSTWKNSALITTKGLGHNLKSAEILRRVMGYVSETNAVTLSSANSPD